MELIKKALANIDLSRFYAYTQELTLTDRNTEDTKSFSLNDSDFYLIMPYCTLLDSNGKPLENGNNRHNEMRIVFENEKGHNYFENPITVQALNRMHKNERYLGFYLTDSDRYRVTLNSTNYPTKDINKFPVRSEFHLIGYSLSENNPKYSINNVMPRVNGQRPYTIEKSFDIATNTSESVQKVTVGNDELFINEMNITMTDSEGRDVILDDRITDAFVIKIKGSDDWVMFENVNLRAFVNLWQSKQWKGIVLKQRTDYWFTISGKNFPAGISTLKFDAKTANFTIGDTITGGTSSATGVIAGIVENGATGTLILTDITGTFADNETIVGAITGSATSDGVISDGACLYSLKAQLTLQGYKLSEQP